ncbi:Zinc finger N-recognin metazoa [Penicillium brevicompactum]|uniref:Zinc finger N-recognin metazoa n=1 Tax=Penicillium brevicompactum TaxID=5074 RepID=A0A9W9U979_PENBR|nr:Zinc finger N-recognin metazoa [Penicillium brevicompactum]
MDASKPDQIEGRRASFSSHNSQTAKEFIDSQLQLEADAREALPYSFDSCTYALGPLRQTLFACITCNPPPTNPNEPYTAAAVCYSCSISCHGEHTLVELFYKRNFVCDCGTTRMPSSSCCTLRDDPATGKKGAHSQEAAPGNTYSQNFRNKFCGCGEQYDAFSEKGTMFQCLGLGTVETGGCGEDWWHPECLIGLSRDWNKSAPKDQGLGGDAAEDDADEETPLPPGFPAEDDFQHLICYKCVDSNPWIKQYAGSPGFLPPVMKNGGLQKAVIGTHVKDTDEPKPEDLTKDENKAGEINTEENKADQTKAEDHKIAEEPSKKRKADDEEPTETAPAPKRSKDDNTEETQSKPITLETQPKETASTVTPSAPKHAALPKPTPTESLSLFATEDFHNYLCRCAECFPYLVPHPQLREAEETYEPPVSEDGDADGAASAGTGSIYDRGEAALNGVDRVRAIEGAMAYNHLRDNLKAFLKPFAESGQAVSAEDIKGIFEKLRGDDQGIQDAANQASDNTNDKDGSNSHEQSGY